MSAARRIAEASRRLDRLDQVAIATLSLLGAAGVIAMFLLAAAQLRAGRIDGPMVVLLVLGTLAVMEVLSPLRRGALEFGHTTLAARRLLPFLRLHPETHGASTGFERISSKQAPILSLYDVEYRYGEGRAPVLAGFSLTVAPGERIALQGMSGSGKSTLLAMIAGLVEPTAGCIGMGGRTLQSIPSTERVSSIGFLTQQTELYGDTIAGNLRVAAAGATEKELWSALAAVELDGKIRALPEGLEARLGEGGSGLSGGEARRLALARVILKRAPIWLLDEPTAGLDEALRRESDGQRRARGWQRNRHRCGTPLARGGGCSSHRETAIASGEGRLDADAGKSVRANHGTRYRHAVAAAVRADGAVPLPVRAADARPLRACWRSWRRVYVMTGRDDLAAA